MTEAKVQDRAASKKAEADEKKRRHLERKLDEALEETFPGSDPVSLSQPAKSAEDRDADCR